MSVCILNRYLIVYLIDFLRIFIRLECRNIININHCIIYNNITDARNVLDLDKVK